MGRDDPQFNLRLPYELKEKLKQRAKSNGRSINAEIISAIELWIKIHKGQLIPSSSRILTKSEQEAFDVAIDVLKRVRDGG
ncbi:Arc family DNA-binding protein [Salmonella enterica subsp. enterica serovar Schwarzengrund]|nr:Arc family DNA-binding protein [Salmonella enterica subsp. enterica serovar Schwarzengrund]EJY1650485.1 Arc family DNA-binding protein [Salmonella enterica subsp. enterica serovar Schwarzengrund]